MLQPKSWNRNPLNLLRSRASPSSKIVVPFLDGSKPVEEEQTPYYDPKYFYPARLGEILNGRYQIATKVGYGTESTMWLARHLFQWRWSAERFVTVKIGRAHRGSYRPMENESNITRHVTKVDSHHRGWRYVRTLLDSFNLKGLSDKIRGRHYSVGGSEVMVLMILYGLEYLHDVCHVIHGDLKENNIMMNCEDDSILRKSALDEFQDPLPQKQCSDRTIYQSRNDYGISSSITGMIEIIDFGLAVCGDGPHYGPIQIPSFRAPEVILDAGWTYSSDIWNLGVMLWNLVQNKALFAAVTPPKAEYSSLAHIALITAFLSPPPRELLAQGKRTSLLYDSEGSLKPSEATPSSPNESTLENTISVISGEEKNLFLDFVGRMLKWNPQDRSTAKELRQHSWFRTDLCEDFR